MTCMGGGKGKKNVNARRKTCFSKNAWIRNWPALKETQQPLLQNQQ